MDKLDERLKQYSDSIPVPGSVHPSVIKKEIEKSDYMTAGMFLKKLREMGVSGESFLQLLGNSRIGNTEYHRIMNNPHLRYDELLVILNSSGLESKDYRTMIAAAELEKEKEAEKNIPAPLKQEEKKEPVTEEISVTEEETPVAEEETPVTEEETPIAEETPVTEEETSATEEKQPENPLNDKPFDNPHEDEKRIQAANELIERIMASSGDDDLDSAPDEVGKESSDKDIDDDEERLAAAQAMIDKIMARDNTEPEAEPEEKEEEKKEEKEEKEEEPEEEPEEKEEQKSEAENEDNDTDTDEDDEIGSSAKDLGEALEDLVEDTPSPKNKKALIGAFIGAGILLAAGITLKVLMSTGVIPQYEYNIPGYIEQEITDYNTLLSEAKLSAGKVNYTLPQGFTAESVGNNSSLTLNTGAANGIAAISENEGKYTFTAANVKEGKVQDTIVKEIDIENPTLAYAEGKYIIAGMKEGKTVVRFYDSTKLTDFTPTAEYIIDGEYKGGYIANNRLMAVSYLACDENTATAENLSGFVPGIKTGDNYTSVSFENITMPQTVNAINYCMVSAIPLNEGEVITKAVLIGDAGGFCADEKGITAVDNTDIAGGKISTLTRVIFDDSLTVTTAKVNGVLNPSCLGVGDNYSVACGTESTENGTSNIMATLDNSGNLKIMQKLASGENILSVKVRGAIATVITDGEHPSYTVLLKDFAPDQNGAEEITGTKVNEELSLKTVISTDNEGNRTGVILSALDKENKQTASLEIKIDVPSEWNAYLTCPTADNNQPIAYGKKGETYIVGVPLIYFDGVSRVNEYRFYTLSGNEFKDIGSIVLYDDEYKSVLCRITEGDKPFIITMWDDRIVTADTDKVKIISDVKLS